MGTTSIVSFTRIVELTKNLILKLFFFNRIINISYATSSAGSTYDSNEIFAIIIVFIIAGSLVVAFNAKFLGGQMYFFFFS